MKHIATIGATLSGNKGAAAMLQSVIQNLPPLVGDVRFHVLSVYPAEDRELDQDSNVRIVPAKPAALLLSIPSSILWRASKALHLPFNRILASPVVATLAECDMLVDLGGISFSDGRTIELFYNIACILPALVMGKRVVKYSQAMGPFKSTLNRLAALWLLPKVTLIIARGNRTMRHLEQLGLHNTALCADAAFSLLDQRDSEGIPAYFVQESMTDSRIVGIAPSAVAQAYCERLDIDYCAIMADFSDQAVAQGYRIWIVPHAVRRSSKGGRTNDLETCQAIHHLVKDKSKCRVVADDYSPMVLRAIIGLCDFFVASRFHAMVSSLSTQVPTIAVGWSHKYAEVMSMFDLEEWVIGHEELCQNTLQHTFQALIAQGPEIRQKIARSLPAVIQSSRQGAVLTAQLIQD